MCADLCAGVLCPPPKTCSLGECKAPCNCYAGDIGCNTGEVCDKSGSKECVPPACQGKTCQTGEHCDATGTCVGLCSGVACPQGQKCDTTKGCVDLCDGVSCGAGDECDPKTGSCVPSQCKTLCIPPTTCVAGQCVVPEGGIGGSGGALNDAGNDAAAASGGSLPKGGTTDAGDDGGCGWRAPASAPVWPAALLAMLSAFGLLFRRRSR